MTTLRALRPLLVYEDIQAAHDQLVAAFGFTSGGLHRDDAGNVVHGEVVVAGETVYLHTVNAEHQLASPRSSDEVFGGMVVEVADVNQHYDIAKAAGANITAEPVDQPYGVREYEARDIEGHRWWFASPIQE